MHDVSRRTRQIRRGTQNSWRGTRHVGRRIGKLARGTRGCVVGAGTRNDDWAGAIDESRPEPVKSLETAEVEN